MSSQENEDIERIRHTLGGEFDYRPADETLSDAKLIDFSIDAKTPELSALQAERLSLQNNSNPGVHADSPTRDELFGRFTGFQGDLPDVPKNRVYLKTTRMQSDRTEAFAAKPVVVSGTTGKITERG